MKEWLKQLYLSDHHYHDLAVMIQTEDDFNEFMNHFWKGWDKQTLSKTEYRTYKLGKTNIDLNDFLEMYARDKVQALKTLFQHHVTDYEVKLLEKKMKTCGFTLEDLYKWHQSDKEKKLLTWLSTA